jgi:hypothetical protein
MSTPNQVAGAVQDPHPNVVHWARHYHKDPAAVHKALVAAMGEEYDRQSVDESVILCLVLDDIDDETQPGSESDSSYTRMFPKRSSPSTSGNPSSSPKRPKNSDMDKKKKAADVFAAKRKNDRDALDSLNATVKQLRENAAAKFLERDNLLNAPMSAALVTLRDECAGLQEALRKLIADADAAQTACDFAVNESQNAPNDQTVCRLADQRRDALAQAVASRDKGNVDFTEAAREFKQVYDQEVAENKRLALEAQKEGNKLRKEANEAVAAFNKKRDAEIKYAALGITTDQGKLAYEESWKKRNDDAPPTERDANTPTGNFLDLFDPDRLLFDYSTNPKVKGFVNFEEARQRWRAMVPKKLQQEMSTNMLRKLEDTTTTPTKVSAKNCTDRLWNGDNGKYSTYVTRLLMTRCEWSTRFTYGALLVNFFVQLHSAYQMIVQRTRCENVAGVAKFGNWTKLVAHFVNGLAASLCQVMVYGPDSQEKQLFQTIKREHDSPMLCVLCVPLLTMVKRYFPNFFDLKELEKKTTAKFIKNLKGRGMKWGIYGLNYLKTKCKAVDQEDVDFGFVRGSFYPFNRIVSLFNSSISLKKYNILASSMGGEKREYEEWYRISKIEYDMYCEVASFRVYINWGGNKKVYFAQRLWAEKKEKILLAENGNFDEVDEDTELIGWG